MSCALTDACGESPELYRPLYLKSSLNVLCVHFKAPGGDEGSNVQFSDLVSQCETLTFI